MYRNKPVIGLAGGIGSGKSFVANLFAQCGCFLIDSDALARAAMQESAVVETLRQWWGDDVALPDGRVNRSAVAAHVFGRPADRIRLENLLHPRVSAAREAAMEKTAGDPAVQAFVWDSPLLFETGLDRQCDAVVFVDAPRLERVRRVTAGRGWDVAELDRREKFQWPLDKKRQMSDYSLSDTADAGDARGAMQTLCQVQEILQRVLVTADNVD